MIAEPGDAERDVNVNETFHEQTDDELSKRELKQIEDDDQAIQTILLVRAEGNAAGHNGNQIRCYNYRGVGHFARDCTIRPWRRDAAYLQTQLFIAQKEEAGIQLQAEEYDLMAAAADLDEIEEVNENCILLANLQQASSSDEQYTELLEPIPEPQQVPQNDNNVISEVTDVMWNKVGKQ
nr:hypothetical protein [Tanacetum cinerariifolium]